MVFLPEKYQILAFSFEYQLFFGVFFSKIKSDRSISIVGNKRFLLEVSVSMKKQSIDSEKWSQKDTFSPFDDPEIQRGLPDHSIEGPESL